MNYLLDTNAVAALMRNKPTGVRERYREAEASGDYLAVSSVVLFEFWYGVEKSTQVRGKHRAPPGLPLRGPGPAGLR